MVYNLCTERYGDCFDGGIMPHVRLSALEQSELRYMVGSSEHLRVFDTFLIWAEILFQFLPSTVKVTVIQVEVEC